MIRKAKHYIEAYALQALFFIFRNLPLAFASAVGAFLAQAIGPCLSAHKTAYDNLTAAFPDLSTEKKNVILFKMWMNLGRVAAELAHLSNKALIKRIKITGAENLPVPEKPAFMFSGHVGNWELLALVAQKHGRPVTGVYREANNLIVDDFIANIRRKHYYNLIPKGRQGAVKIVRAIKNNEAISMLVDQKMNDGIVVPFFGRDAMTAPAIAELALRYNAPIIPARVIRTRGANFKTIIYPPLEYEKTGDKERDVYNIMLSVNKMLEEWIREYPEQWFWVHKRWPKE